MNTPARALAGRRTRDVTNPWRRLVEVKLWAINGPLQGEGGLRCCCLRGAASEAEARRLARDVFGARPAGLDLNAVLARAMPWTA